LKLNPAILSYIGLKGIMDVASTREYSVGYSPFGKLKDGGTAYVRRAAPWKGLSMAELPSAVRAGLQRAIAMSKSHTEKGVVIVNVQGDLVRMPRKAFEMMKAGKNKHLIKGVSV